MRDGGLHLNIEGVFAALKVMSPPAASLLNNGDFGEVDGRVPAGDKEDDVGEGRRHATGVRLPSATVSAL